MALTQDTGPNGETGSIYYTTAGPDGSHCVGHRHRDQPDIPQQSRDHHTGGRREVALDAPDPDGFARTVLTESGTGSVTKSAVKTEYALLLDVQVWIGGIQAEVEYAGAAPGEVAGMLQVNARVPSLGRWYPRARFATARSESVVLQIGRATSQPGVFLFVQ